jgi:O-antigen/teichoic acid export membrane protein
MIGLSKYFDLILGNNNAIILILNIIAQFYFLLFWCFLTVGLNMIFIPIYGILGSAFATLLSITLYSLAKLMFVVKRLHLFPLLNKRYILWV